MIAPAAIQQFTERQRQLVHDTYDQAWRQGVTGYQSDEDPTEPTSVEHHHGEEATLTGLPLLAARTQRAYRPPSEPDMARRQQALAGALHSTDRMARELATLSPTPEQREEAEQELGEGSAIGLVTAATLALAVAQWAESNSQRLDQGASVAWAGEQAGYAEAANQDGQLLQWEDEGDDHVCADCEALADMGPMPLENFPTYPGDGATACDAGCRCSMVAVPLEDAPPAEEDQQTLDRIAMQATERMDRTMPELAMTG